jgi:hypothetical protein
MQVFHCDHCDQLLFYENVQCVNCQKALAFLPDLNDMASLEPAKEQGLWTTKHPKAKDKKYRLCQNYTQYQVCNWAEPADDSNPLCTSCRLTRVVPNLAQPGNREGWYKLEVAKRRLVYTLQRLNLPLVPKTEDPERGLAFEFLADPIDGGAAVLTGHASGVITINLAEADDAEREKRRVDLREPFRTLLGHFRHEVGHYYWDLLIAESNRLEAYRQLFGDEQPDYGQALQNYYQNGAPRDWQQQYVSAYASAHSWEDWAETWAHYLHMIDTLQTASACGLSLKPRHPKEPELTQAVDPLRRAHPFDTLIDDWFPLTYLLNNLNRGLGLADGYPFVLSTPALDKLRFVHETVLAAKRPTEKPREANNTSLFRTQASRFAAVIQNWKSGATTATPAGR